MVDNDIRVIDDPSAGQLRSPAPILVLAVHEESFVEWSDLMDHRPPRE
jgi:hypothetical protein